jgi:hypothetical protein
MTPTMAHSMPNRGKAAMYCPQCHTPNPAWNRNCSACGIVLFTHDESADVSHPNINSEITGQSRLAEDTELKSFVDFAIDRALHFWTDRMLAGGVMLLCLSIVLGSLFHHEHLYSHNDLSEITGEFYAYSVYPAGKGIHHGITLRNDPRDFVIPADCVDALLESKLRENVNYGDRLTLNIPKVTTGVMTTSSTVLVFGIHRGDSTYLNPVVALKEYVNSRKLVLLIFVLMGSVLFFGRLLFLTFMRNV